MRAILKPAPGPGATLADVPAPVPGPDEALVEIQATSICGTDLHIYDWNAWAARRIKPPRVFGHEMAGHVRQVGDRVTQVRVGDYVAAETHIVDHTCRQCRLGLTHICQNVRIVGVDRDGSFAQLVTLPAETLWHTDPRLDAATAALQEPFGNAVHATLAGPIADQTVAIFGCGPIGLCAIGVALAEGAAAVYAVDVNPFRLELAERMGATAVINARAQDPVVALKAANHGDEVDVCLEMSGNPAATAQALEALRSGGWISLLGLGDAPVTLDLNTLVIMKGITIFGVTGRRIWATWERTSALLTSGRVDVAPIMTHRLPLEDFEEAMALLKAGKTGKIVLYPNGGPPQ
jgi:threonine 3-dehydrogenase